MIGSIIVRTHQQTVAKRGGGSPLLPAKSMPPPAEDVIAELPADHVLADKGYASKALRETIVSQEAMPVIPPVLRQRLFETESIS